MARRWGGVVQPRLFDAGKHGHRILDLVDAGGAIDALDGEIHAGASAVHATQAGGIVRRHFADRQRRAGSGAVRWRSKRPWEPHFSMIRLMERNCRSPPL